MKQKFKLSHHSIKRLKERFNVNNEKLLNDIQNNNAVLIEQQIPENRNHLLYYSPEDKKFIVIIYNSKTLSIITVMPIKYWHRSIERRFPDKKIITRKALRQAVSLTDNNNQIIHHPPIGNHTKVKISFVIDKNGLDKTVNLGSIDIDFILNSSVEKIDQLIKEITKTKIEQKKISIADKIKSIIWGLSQDRVKSTFNLVGNNSITFSKKIKIDFKKRLESERLYSEYDDITDREIEMNNF